MFRPLLQWKEPREYVLTRHQIEKAKERPVHRLITITAVFILMLGIWASAHADPEKTLPPWWAALILSALYVWFSEWVVPWINRRSASHVKLFKKRVIRTNGSSNLSVPYTQYLSHYWLHAEHFYTLILVARARRSDLPGGFLSIGVPDEVVQSEASVILMAAGIPEAKETDRTTHLKTFPSPISGKRILFHLLPAIALSAAGIYTLITRPDLIQTLGTGGSLYLMFGLSITYLFLALAVSNWLQRKRSRSLIEGSNPA